MLAIIRLILISGMEEDMSTSLYKHFKGKEDILNALIDSAEAEYE